MGKPVEHSSADHLDAQIIELLRRSGLIRHDHQISHKIVESLTKSDIEIFKRYIIRFMQSHEKQTHTLERIAKALEKSQGGKRHAR